MKLNHLVLSAVMLASGLMASPMRTTAIDLGGEWRFSTEDRPEQAQADGKGAGWSNIRLPGFWEDQGFPGHDGFAWAVREVRAEKGRMPAALRIEGLFDEAEVFVNGASCGKLRGTLGLGANLFPAHEALRLNLEGRFKEGPNRIALRFYDNPARGEWIWRDLPYPSAKGKGGIEKSIVLETAPAVHLRSVALRVVKKALPESVFRFEAALSVAAGRKASGALELTAAGKTQRASFRDQGDGAVVPIEISVPPGFGEKTWTLSCESEGQKDSLSDHWHTVVVETKEGKIFVNGEVFLVKGLNGSALWQADPGEAVLDLLEDANVNLLRPPQGSHVFFRQYEKRQSLMLLPVVSGHVSCKKLDEWDKPVPGKSFTFAYSATNELPDYAAQAAPSPMILGWNTLNEIETRLGTGDEKILEGRLSASRELLRKGDGWERPCVYANLQWDSQRVTGGQDLVGFNYYIDPLVFDFHQLKKLCGDKPFVFTETDLPSPYWKDPWVTNYAFHLSNHAAMASRALSAGGSGMMIYSGLTLYTGRHPGMFNGDWRKAASLPEMKLVEVYRDGIRYLYRDFDQGLASGHWAPGETARVRIKNIMPYALRDFALQCGAGKTETRQILPGESAELELRRAGERATAVYTTHGGLRHRTSFIPGEVYSWPKVDAASFGKALWLPEFRPTALRSVNGLSSPAFAKRRDGVAPDAGPWRMEKASPESKVFEVERVEVADEGSAFALRYSLGLPGAGNDWVRFRQELPVNDLTGWDGLALRVKGDGKVRRMGLVLFDGKGKAIDYVLVIPASEGWQDIFIGFADAAVQRTPAQFKELDWTGVKWMRLQFDDRLLVEDLLPRDRALLHTEGESQVLLGEVALVKTR